MRLNRISLDHGGLRFRTLRNLRASLMLTQLAFGVMSLRNMRRQMPFDLTDLRLFLQIVEAGSITQGAERAHLALAAASTRSATWKPRSARRYCIEGGSVSSLPRSGTRLSNTRACCYSKPSG